MPLDITYTDDRLTMRNYKARVTAAHKLMHSLTLLFSRTSSLREIVWTRCPGPSRSTLEVMAAIASLESVVLNCATGEWAGRNMDDCDEYYE